MGVVKFQDAFFFKGLGVKEFERAGGVPCDIYSNYLDFCLFLTKQAAMHRAYHDDPSCRPLQCCLF